MLDDTDFRLLTLLQRDGVIEAYVALVNQEKVGRPLIVFCNVAMPDYTPENIAEFENHVRQMPDVLEAYHLAGIIDYQLKIVMSDIKQYASFLQHMARLPMIQVYSSSIALYAVKQSTVLPLPTKNTLL